MKESSTASELKKLAKIANEARSHIAAAVENAVKAGNATSAKAAT